MFEKFQNLLERFVGPVAQKMSDSKTIQSLTNGMMAVLPVTLGVAFIVIVGQFPLPAWQNFLTELGLTQIIADLINVTSGLYAIYIVATISYETAKIENCNPITSIVLSMAFFLILVPQTIVPADGYTIAYIATGSLGSEGIFVGMMSALFVTRFYAMMTRKNALTIKLPDAVPPMVSESLSPTFVAMFIFIIAFILKVGFAKSPFGDALTFVNTLITAPIAELGSSPIAVVTIFTFANLLWFFGIHPAAIINLFYAITAPVFIANFEAFMAGTPQPYFEFMFISSIIMLGGTGNTIGLAISMLTAKSERYKSMKPLAFVPSLFNINEPLIFGMPVMLNPIFFIPLMLSVIVAGGIVHLFYAAGFLTYFNAAIELPWIMPPVISQFLYANWQFAVVIIVVIAALTLLYYPFFRMADNKALEEERNAQ